MNIPQYYSELNQNSAKVQNETFANADTLGAHIVSHGFLGDYSILLEYTLNRYESPVFELALREYQFALLALSYGQYRHAYIGLRLFFEMTIAGYHFSTNEFDYRLWEKNGKDIIWKEITDEDKSIFSKKFVTVFNEDLADQVKPFASIASKVYRECSEYVHGNLHTHKSLPQQNIFDRTVCLAWHEKAKSMHFVILFLFSIRYLPKLNFQNNAKHTTLRNKLEAIILSELGHIAELRNQF